MIGASSPFSRVYWTVVENPSLAVTISLIGFSTIGVLFFFLGSSRERKIASIPGSRLKHVLRFFSSRRTYERVFHEQFLDMEQEFIEALDAKELVRARWVIVRGHIFLVASVGLYLWTSTIGKFLKAIVGIR